MNTNILTQAELDKLTNTGWNAPHVVRFVTQWPREMMPHWAIEISRQYLKMPVKEQRKHYVVEHKLMELPYQKQYYKRMRNGKWQRHGDLRGNYRSDFYK